MKTNSISILTTLAVLGLGCAHVHRVQEPQMCSEFPSGVAVGIGGDEVKKSDLVDVINPVCRQATRLRVGKVQVCDQEEVIGTATILKVIDEDTAIAQARDGLVLNNSMKVEKQGR